MGLFLARRRGGLGRLIGVFIAGLSDGEPWAYGLLAVIVVGLVGFVAYKLKANAAEDAAAQAGEAPAVEPEA